MTQFDQMLRRGLMDANLAQYETVLRQADGREPDFSPRYLRERTRMLADPWGWVRRYGGKRLNWRLIVIAALLALILSACAYAVATGQFSQWFPSLGINLQAPEDSEDVLNRTGTAIGQSQTAGGATVTLNAAVWDGDYVYLSLAIESPDIPEEVIAYTPLYTDECYLRLPEEQLETYVRKNLEHFYAETGQPPVNLEEEIQAGVDKGQKDFSVGFDLISRENNTLAFMLTKDLFAYVEQPELTLHLENIATYADGKGESILDENGYAIGPGPGEIFVEGPFDLTFTLEAPVLPVHYGHSGLEILLGDVPMRFKKISLSAMKLTAAGDVLVPVNMPGYSDTPDPEGLDCEEILFANMNGPWGLWTEDGTYVDLAETDSSNGFGGDPGGTVESSMVHSYPYPIDPATITAVNIGGIRVELSEWETLPE